MTGRHDVSVTGLGMVSPLGIGVQANWVGLQAGLCVATRDPLLDGMPVDFSCAVPDFDPGALLGRRLAWRLDPFAQMALVAAREAVADAGLRPTDWEPARVAVVLGVANGSTSWDRDVRHILDGEFKRVSPLALPRSLPNLAAGEVSTDLRAMGPSYTVSSACASGATAIGIGRDLLRADACDIAVVGGAESGRTRLTSAGFSRMGALSTRGDDPASASRPFDRDRDGFVLAEGAAVLVLERRNEAMVRNARVHGHLIGSGASADAHHFTAPDPEGGGAEIAIRTALRDADLAPGDVGHINAHGTSTHAGDTAEATVIARLFPHSPPVTATKSLIGHSLGATGALEAGFTLLTLAHQIVPPIANLHTVDVAAESLALVRGAPQKISAETALSNSFGFGGQNAVLVFSAA